MVRAVKEMSRGGLAALAASLMLAVLLASCGGGGCSIPGWQRPLPQPAPEQPAAAPPGKLWK